MTLDEAIERELYRTEANREMADSFHTDENVYSKEEEAYRNREDYHSQIAEWLKELKKDREILNGLSIYFQSLVVEAVINQRPCMFDMRDATEAERKSVMRYIANSVFTTGVDFWNIIGEVNADGDSD